MLLLVGLPVEYTIKPCYNNPGAEVIEHNGQKREYMVYIPPSYEADEPVPLLMNFHGFGASASDYMAYADLRELADSKKFILVYPQGSCIGGMSHWNPCPVGGDNKSEADDFGFIEAMIDQITSEYQVDMKRIYAAGYSNGGMMAYGLAHYKSELIAAIASVSGTMLDCVGPEVSPKPVVHFHGTADSVIPYEGNSYYNSAQAVVDYWVGINNTLNEPTVSSDNGIDTYLYEPAKDGIAVAHYKFNESDHIWFNETFQGKSTAQLIWGFVSDYDINGPR